MDYLQYNEEFKGDKKSLDEVLNLVINGLPSILKHSSFISSMYLSF